MRPKQQWGKRKSLTPLILLVRQAGFEPATYGLEVRCSIQLSYWRLWDGRCRAYNIIGEIIILKAGQKATAFVSMRSIYGFLPDRAIFRIDDHDSVSDEFFLASPV